MIVFDVGANNGDQSFPYCSDPKNIVYAFEPTPSLLNAVLYPKQRIRKNFNVIPKAVGDRCGKVIFNIAANSGCNSIHEFNNNLSETWPGRNDFVVTDKIEVEMITLEKFLDENPHIVQIDHFHCDTQGNDILVLKGMGKHINKIQKGVIEVTAKNPLYKNINNSMEEAVAFLESKGFETYVVDADIYGNEVNLGFRLQNQCIS